MNKSKHYKPATPFFGYKYMYFHLSCHCDLSSLPDTQRTFDGHSQQCAGIPGEHITDLVPVNRSQKVRVGWVFYPLLEVQHTSHQNLKVYSIKTGKNSSKMGYERSQTFLYIHVDVCIIIEMFEASIKILYFLVLHLFDLAR